MLHERLNKIKKGLELANLKIDSFFIEIGLKKRPLTAFEKILQIYIQSFVLNLKSGLTLEQSLVLASENTPVPQELIQEFKIRSSATLGLSYFVAKEPSDKVKRFSRLVVQNKKTGGVNITYILDQFANELLMESFESFKKKSEKVSVQLTFLLSMALVSVIIITIAPVMLTL